MAKEKVKTREQLQQEIYELQDKVMVLGAIASRYNSLVSRDRCVDRIHEGEPLFVLRAQDRLASVAIRYWADLAAAELGDNHPKVFDANQKAISFDEWGMKNVRHMPD